MELGDGLKKLLLAGVGTVAVTAEKQEKFWMNWIRRVNSL